MHIGRKPGEQVEVDWAGDPAHIIDPDTGEITEAYLFVGVMTYSQYTYVEAFINQKKQAWITAHVHMYDYFGGVAKILVLDNCTTAVNHKKSDWYTTELNAVYHEMAEHYGTAIIPARVRKPKDKPNAESSVGNISTWITAALRNEQFFSLSELNLAIREKLRKFNENQFQKKESSRRSLFLEEELPLLSPLPATQVFGAIAGEQSATYARKSNFTEVTDNELIQCFAERFSCDEGGITDIPNALKEIRKIMWECGAIVRSEKRCADGFARITQIESTFNPIHHFEQRIDIRKISELVSSIQLAKILLGVMNERRESRGPHYRSDFPDQVSKFNGRVSVQKGSDCPVYRLMK